MTPRRETLWTSLGTLFCVVWLTAAAVTGHLADDGLHAYAARELLHGRRLYADFAYHQPPLFPLVLSWWFRLVGVGLWQARLLVLLVGLGVVAVVLWLVKRQGGSTALAAWLMALSPSLMLHLTYVQSQGFATLLGLLGLAAILAAKTDSGLPSALPDLPCLAAAWLCITLAFGARLSFGVLWLPLAVITWRRGPRAVAVGLVTAGVTLALVFGPAMASGRGLDALYLPFGGGANAVSRSFLELYLPSHGLLDSMGRRVGGWPNQLVYYAPLWLVVILAFAQQRRGGRTLLAAAILLTIAQGVLPRRINHSYLVVAMPCWAAWVAGSGVVLPRRSLLVIGLGLCSLLAGLRAWGRLDYQDGTVLARINEVAQAVRNVVPPDGKLFTFSVEVAVAADREVVPGLEPGYFSYYANLPTSEARRCHLMNHELLLEVLDGEPALTPQPPLPRVGEGLGVRGRIDAILLHDRAFEPLSRTDYPWPDSSELWAVVETNYDLVASWPHAGESGGRLRLWVPRRRDLEDAGQVAERHQ